jgi:hypothetical protein
MQEAFCRETRWTNLSLFEIDSNSFCLVCINTICDICEQTLEKLIGVYSPQAQLIARNKDSDNAWNEDKTKTKQEPGVANRKT